MSTKRKASVIRQSGSSPRRSAAQWAKLVRQQRRSGRTVEAYCTERSLAESTFWYWRRRVEVKLEDKPEMGLSARFLAIPVSVPSEPCEVMVGDLRVRLDAVAAQRVLDAIVARIAGSA